jgi:uncharacterized protein (DUF362 family)
MLEKDFTPSHVVHVHASGATSWDFETGWYGDHVDQDVVNEMMECGLTALHGTSSATEAWNILLPAYLPGKKIAIKVNLVNAEWDESGNAIDALIHPVNALIRSMVRVGVQEEDVWVYDAIRPMPARFYDSRQYTKSIYFDSEGNADEVATFDHVDTSLQVDFSHPAMQMERWLTDLLYNATYVINMPILKKHGLHPVTLGFKNHFGSLSYLRGPGDDDPHHYIKPYDSRYSPDFSPLVDVNANPNIAQKTVLTIGDGLFGAPSYNGSPIPWSTYGDQAPNSLLFSCDPVALDCVMCDLLQTEWGLAETAYDYLRLAQERGLGTFDRDEPSGVGYKRIRYTIVELIDQVEMAGCNDLPPKTVPPYMLDSTAELVK